MSASAGTPTAQPGHLPAFERVAVYLDGADLRDLRRLAASQNLAMAALVRAVVHDALEDGRRVGRLRLDLGRVDWPYPGGE